MTERPPGDQIVEQYWPYDGLHSADSVASAAQVIAGLVRYMCNATWNPKRLSGPDLYRVLSSLNSAVWGLDQLLDQLVHITATVAEDETLYDSGRDRPGALTAGEVAAHLVTARSALAGESRTGIDRAAQLASRLGHDTPGGGAS